MLKRKWKNTIIISVAIVVLAIIVGVFSIVIINTPNLNSYINISAKDVLGSVEINIKNAETANLQHLDIDSSKKVGTTSKLEEIKKLLEFCLQKRQKDFL